MRYKFIFLGIILFLIFTNNVCKKTPVEPEEVQRLNLSLESILCTEVYLRLNVRDLALPIRLEVYCNDSLVSSIGELRSIDTILIVENLQPKRSYDIYVKGTGDGINYYRSNLSRFITLDTTSRNFTWQVFEFGDIGLSALHDVAIIDENDIWAVGEIRIADTSINGYTTYNAVHWDGSNWELKKIGRVGGWACHTVFAFSANDIWFEGNIHWDGSKYKVHMNGWPLMPNGDGWQVNKMWGSSSSDLYAVGYNDNIAHWDGNRWTKIESGVDVNFIDIHGQTSDGKIFICGYNTVNEYKATLLEIKDKNVRVKWYKTNVMTYDPPYGGTIHNIFTSGDYLFTVGSKGFFRENVRLGTYPKKVLDYAPDWVYAMRGNDVNDVFTFSDQNEIYHYNGYNLRKIYGNHLILHAFYGGNVKGDIVVGVGLIYVDPTHSKALLVVGKRR
ncbi:MAG: glucosyl transferase [Ignavibacteria bacterium]|jgi:hypothetical protein|nr:glucosyl transferase [Ignavibacteria bacterium]